MADIATLSFTPIAFPNVPDPNIPNAAQLGLFVIQGSNTVPTGITDGGVIVGHFNSDIGIWTRGPYGSMGFVDAGGSYGAFYGFGPFFVGVDQSGNPVSTLQQTQLFPTGINDSGTVVGNYPGDAFFDTYGFALSNPPDPTLFSPQGLVVSPIVYPGLTFGLFNTFVSGINDSGEIIGNYQDQLQGTSGGFEISPGGVFTALSYTPLAINNNGQIVGEDSSGNILIDTNGSIRNLGMLPFTPTGFNDNGTIVGGDYVYNNGFLTQIQLYGETSVQINAINDGGYFVGSANGPGGQVGFETITPEPFAGLPILAGLCAIGILRFRTRRLRSRIAG